jgi:hypothetical protein
MHALPRKTLTILPERGEYHKRFRKRGDERSSSTERSLKQ